MKKIILISIIAICMSLFLSGCVDSSNIRPIDYGFFNKYNDIPYRLDRGLETPW